MHREYYSCYRTKAIARSIFFIFSVRSVGRESVIGCNFGMRLHLESLDADFDDASRLELVHKIDLCMRVLKTSTYFWITTALCLCAESSFAVRVIIQKRRLKCYLTG